MSNLIHSSANAIVITNKTVEVIVVEIAYIIIGSNADGVLELNEDIIANYKYVSNGKSWKIKLVIRSS